MIGTEKSVHGTPLARRGSGKRGRVEDGVLGQCGTRGWHSSEEENFFQIVPFNPVAGSVSRSGGVYGGGGGS